MRLLFITLSLFTSLYTNAKPVLKHCDDEAGKAAIEAHLNKYKIAQDTGCDISTLRYIGRSIQSKKFYEVIISDEVDTIIWLVEADAENNCQITDIADLGIY